MLAFTDMRCVLSRVLTGCKLTSYCSLERHPNEPMGCSLFMHIGCCSQGGGVYVNGGAVTFQSCEFHTNQATGVSVQPRTPPPNEPMGSLV